MGIIKKLFRPLFKETEQTIYQAKALFKHDKIEKGEKVLAPKHPTDEKHFKETQKNEKIREEINKRRDDVIENVNKIRIKSIDPPEKPYSHRPLPTRADEQEYLLTTKNEYGFYEPPPDKMLPGKLTLREAMDLLYAKTEIELEGREAENANKVLQTHPATSRISTEDIETLYKYYRPFVRKDTQRVVNKYDLQTLSDFMNNRGHFEEKLKRQMLGDPLKYLKKINKVVFDRYLEIEDEKKDEILQSVLDRQQEEHKRLHDKMKDLVDEIDLISKDKKKE